MNVIKLTVLMMSLGVLASCSRPQETSMRGEAGGAFDERGLEQPLWTVNVPGSLTQIEFERARQIYRLNQHDVGISRAFPQKRLLRFRNATVDPIVSDPFDVVPEELRALPVDIDAPGSAAYLVQFVAQPIQAMQDHLRSLGATLYSPFPDHAYIMHMDAATAETVRGLQFVRWIGRYHAAYKLDAAVTDRVVTQDGRAIRYSVLVMGDPESMQETVAAQVRALGGAVDLTTSGRRMEVTLDERGVWTLAQMKEVLFIDDATEPELDTNIAREIGGAARLETVRGYTGQGIRAEVMDSELRTTHLDFQSNPPLIHGALGSGTAHGTSTYGIVFGDGASAPTSRGFLPNAAQPIFAWYPGLTDRPGHTAELVDPAGSYRAVFQSNSWGSGRTLSYTTVSAEMDDILFDNDILITQSQSNAGNQQSRPQAWSKNILSVGGVRHFNTLGRADDQWNNSASIGPAADGRIKPDLWHFYDSTIAPSNSSNTAHTQFGGTSGATPITAGHAGLMFQMWADGVFSGGPGQNRDAFDVRPHMTTAKALLINSAFQYDFSGTTHDKTRVHQGWGMPDVGNLYDLAQAQGWSLPILIDESAVIAPAGLHTYSVTVDGTSPLRATMVYADPAGNPAAAVHRINDLSLRLTSPSGVVFWGNNGLLTSPWSASGGTSNNIDTVENVFIQSPDAGTWTVQILAEEIVQDGHVETGALDADYALVVTHLSTGPINTPPVLGTIGDQTVAEGNTLALTLSASDADGDPITFTASGLPANANLNGTTGAFTFSPDSTQAGAYAVTFIASDNRGGSDAETITITVTDVGGGYASLPYDTGFESGGLDAFWTTQASDPVGRIQVTSANGPRGGFHLTMDSSVNGTYSTNEARLHLDLGGETNVDLSFWWKEFSDENNVEDGVFFSDDGGNTFVKVQDLTGGNSTYSQFTLDVDALAAANGLALTSTFVVKFQQRDNYGITTDGFAFDDISVSGTTGGCTPIYSNDFESGAGGWSFSAADSTCTTGDWTVGNPDGVTNSGVVTQLEDDHSAVGTNAFFTASNSGGAGTDDVDGGVCTGYSNTIDATGLAQVELTFWYYTGQRDAGDDPNGDFFRIDLSNDGGNTFTTNLVSSGDVRINAAWTPVNVTVSNPGQMVIRIQASDGAGPGDLVEGGIDDVQVCVP